MKLLWLDINSSYSHSSLALPALHAQVQNRDRWQDVEWDVMSGTVNENVGWFVQQILTHSPDVIAGTLWLFNHEMMMRVLIRVKALLPKCTILLGGPEFLGENATFLTKNPFVNGVFRGEGEEQFPRWLSCWDTPEKWDDISGLCYIRHGVYRDNGIARVADFSLLDSPESSRFFLYDKPFVQLETSRGCFNTCAFCVSGGEDPVRSLSLSQIEERLKHLRALGVKNVRLLDRTFNHNTVRALELIQLFARYSPHMTFHLELHPALLSSPLKELLQNVPAGLLHIEAGIQSLQQEVITASARKGSVEKAVEGLQFLSGLDNMETHADLIAGLPHYTLPQMVDDVCRLAQIGVGEIQLELLKLLPGTKMRRRASEWGIVYADDVPYEVLQTQAISVEELQYARLLSRMLDGYYNASHWQEVVKPFFSKKEFLLSFLDFLICKSVLDTPLSSEKRGLLLYEFCREFYPELSTQVSVGWLLAGLSLKKQPVELLRTKNQVPPESWEILLGEYNPAFRLVSLPVSDMYYWFGYEVDTPFKRPVFMARSNN